MGEVQKLLDLFIVYLRQAGGEFGAGAGMESIGKLGSEQLPHIRMSCHCWARQ